MIAAPPAPPLASSVRCFLCAQARGNCERVAYTDDVQYRQFRVCGSTPLGAIVCANVVFGWQSAGSGGRLRGAAAKVRIARSRRSRQSWPMDLN